MRKAATLCPGSSQTSEGQEAKRAGAPSLLKAPGSKRQELPEVGGGGKERGHLNWALTGA